MTKTVYAQFSADRTLYYIANYDYQQPKNWCGVELSSATGKYTVYPFMFYDIKSGDRTELPEDHELVLRYVQCEGWPARGSAEWHTTLTRVIENTEHNRKDYQESMMHCEERLALYATLQQEHPRQH